MAKLGKNARRFVIVSPERTGAKGYALREDGTLLVRRGDGYNVKLKPKAGVSAEDATAACEKILERKREQGCEIIEGAVEPTLDTLMKWSFDGVCDAIDGCRVEPDGTCPHGYPSWLLARGLI
jgi:hypothetical protein